MLVRCRFLRESCHDGVEVLPSCATKLSSMNKQTQSAFSILTSRFDACALLDRLIPQFRHHNRPFQGILLDGDSRRGRRIMSNVSRGSDGRARRALWPDEQEEDQTQRDGGADHDAPCDLPVCHGGSMEEGGRREDGDVSPSVRTEWRLGRRIDRVCPGSRKHQGSAGIEEEQLQKRRSLVKEVSFSRVWVEEGRLSHGRIGRLLFSFTTDAHRPTFLYPSSYALQRQLSLHTAPGVLIKSSSRACLDISRSQTQLG